MRWHRVAGVLVAVLVLGAFAPSGVYAQTADEMRRSIDVMRKQLDAQQKRLEQIESDQALQQKKTEMTVNQTVNQAITRQVLESQPPMALLGPAAMPPSAFGLGVFLGFDAQFMKIRGIDFPFAAAQNAASNNLRPVGPWESVDVDREFSPRFSIGFYLPGGRGIISANGLWINSEGTGSFTNIVDSTTCGVIPYAAPGDVINSTSSLACSAKARNEVDYKQVDVQYQYPVQVTRALRLTPEVGVRAVWFDNTATAEYFGCESCANQTEAYFHTIQKSESHGVGPKLGMGAMWEPMPGLSLGAAGSGGFLIGSTDFTHSFCKDSSTFFSGGSATLGCTKAHNFSSDETIGFPFVGGDFSLTYTFPANTVAKGLSLTAGYRVVSYFDMVTRVKFSGGGAASEQHFERKNLMADSFYFGLAYLF
jgi:hypothetical protein